ncbi:hypothetical protein BHM03_00038707 [Ensete ventricosum]|nr:hypothetical protein BHM03_00038707 [Ensete ventricosum]
MHRIAVAMESDVDCGSSDNTFQLKEADNCSFTRIKGRLCDDPQTAVSETSNLLSGNSSNDSYSENAESKATLRSSFAYDTSEDADIPQISTVEAVEGYKFLGRGIPVTGHGMSCRHSRADVHHGELDGEHNVSRCYTNNDSCITGAGDANMLGLDHNLELEKRSCSLLSTCKFGVRETEMVLQVKTAHESCGCNMDANQIKSRKLNTFPQESSRKKSPGPLNVGLPSNSDLTNTSLMTNISPKLDSNSPCRSDLISSHNADSNDIEANQPSQVHGESHDCLAAGVGSSYQILLSAGGDHGQKSVVFSDSEATKSIQIGSNTSSGEFKNGEKFFESASDFDRFKSNLYESGTGQTSELESMLYDVSTLLFFISMYRSDRGPIWMVPYQFVSMSHCTMFDRYANRPLPVGPPADRYIDRSLSGGTVKIDCWRSILTSISQGMEKEEEGRNLVPPCAALPQLPHAIRRSRAKNRLPDPSSAGDSFSPRRETCARKRRFLSKQVSFKKSVEPKVKQLVEGVSQKLAKDSTSSNTKQMLIRTINRSASCKSVSSGHHNVKSLIKAQSLKTPRADPKVFNPKKERNVLERKSSFDLDRQLVSPPPFGRKPLPKLDVKIAPPNSNASNKSELSILCSSKGFDRKNNLGFKEVKKQSSFKWKGNEICDSENKKPGEFVNKEAILVNSAATYMSCSDDGEVTRSSVSPSIDSSHQANLDDTTKDFSGTSRSAVTGVNHVVGHVKLTEAKCCQIDRHNMAAAKPSVDVGLVDGTNKRNKWKDAVKASISKNKMSRRVDQFECKLLKNNIICEASSRSSLTSSSCQKDSSLEGAPYGKVILRVSDTDNGRTDIASDAEQTKHLTESSYVPGVGVLNVNPTNPDELNEKSSAQILPDHPSLLTTDFRFLVVPEHKFIWQYDS